MKIELILKFLVLTKSGEYAELEKSSLEYLRMPELREEIFDEEEYYYHYR